MNRRGIALAVLLNCLLPVSAQIVDKEFQKQQSRVADAVEKFLPAKVRVFIGVLGTFAWRLKSRRTVRQP